MNETATFVPEDTAKVPEATHRLYRALVLSIFEKMVYGHMRLELPDGSLREYGNAGARVSARIRIANEAFFKKCVLYGDVGFGEAYVDGDWHTDSIERVVTWAIENVENLPSMSGSKVKAIWFNLLKVYNRVQHWLRPNSIATSRRNIAEHYDLGNVFYQLWLDATMTYSSALYTSRDQSLEEAQTAKYDSLCRKLRLKEHEHVLEIGSGWGGFSVHAARKYGCKVTTVTISEEQFKFSKERFAKEGLSDRIEIRLADYRSLSGKFDKIASIEMMEALGDRYLETYLSKLNELLKPSGIIGLQYITVPDCRHSELREGIDWIQKHIFPGSLLLSVGRVSEGFNKTGELFLHELEDLGASYAKTLRVWWERFNSRSEALIKLGFDQRFQRKWNYYLQYCEAAFTARNITVVQATYSRPNNHQLHTEF